MSENPEDKPEGEQPNEVEANQEQTPQEPSAEGGNLEEGNLPSEEQQESEGEASNAPSPGEGETERGGLRDLLARIEDALKRGYTIPLTTFYKTRGFGAFFLKTPDDKRTRICTTKDEECEDAIKALPSVMNKLGLAPDFNTDDLIAQLRGAAGGKRGIASNDEGILLESIGPSGKASGFVAELRELLRRRFEFLKKIDDKLTMYTWASTWLALAGSNVPPEEIQKIVTSDSGAVYDVALRTITEALSTYRNYRDELQRLREENEQLKLQVVYWRSKYEMLEEMTSEPNRLERMIETLIAARPDLTIEEVTYIIERFLNLMMTQPLEK